MSLDKLPEEVVQRALTLYGQGLKPRIIAERLGLPTDPKAMSRFTNLMRRRRVKAEAARAKLITEDGPRLVTGTEAVQAKGQHVTPCSDCPWARKALAGWLGSMDADEWLQVAHGEATVECHTLLGAQCAGMAIYRANMAKSPRDPEALRLPSDRARVFSTPMEFRKHHERKGRRGRDA